MTRATEQQFWDATYGDVATVALPDDMRTLALLYDLEPWLYDSAFLFERLGKPTGRRVLSVGGGIDGTAVWLAQQGADVTCLDVSAAAMTRTGELAARLDVESRLRVQVGCCETMTFRDEFDVVLCRKALHHMPVPEALLAIRTALTSSGTFLAHEPVCLSSLLARVHRWLPFHPDYPVMDDERVLSSADLALVEATFPEVRFAFFGLATRPSLAYVADRIGLRRALRSLGQMDHRLLQGLPWLRSVSSSVVIQAMNHEA